MVRVVRFLARLAKGSLHSSSESSQRSYSDCSISAAGFGSSEASVARHLGRLWLVEGLRARALAERSSRDAMLDFAQRSAAGSAASSVLGRRPNFLLFG